MRRPAARLCLLLGTLLAPLAAAGAPDRPPAVVVLEDGADDPAARAALAWMRERLSAAWTVEDGAGLPGLAWPDPACDPGSGDSRGDRVREGLRQGTARFYDDTDEEGARDLLGQAVAAFLEAPCALARDPAARSEAAAGAVLLLRLHLLAGHREAASDLGGRLLRTLGPDEIDAVDVPPEVRVFLEAVRRDGEAHAVALDLEVVPAGTPVLVDGRPAAGASVRVARGTHVLTALGPGGARSRRVRVEGPERAGLRLDLSAWLHPGPEGTLRTAPGAPADLDRRLAAATGRAVIRVARAAGDGSLTARVTADPLRRQAPGTVLQVRPGPGRDAPFQAVASGPLLPRRSWPWPWVSGAASAGLLAAAVVLNVQANGAARDVNDGANRLSDWRSRRDGAVACYALGAAAGVGTVVLAVLGRPGAERVVLSPAPGGLAVGYGQRF